MLQLLGDLCLILFVCRVMNVNLSLFEFCVPVLDVEQTI